MGKVGKLIQTTLPKLICQTCKKTGKSKGDVTLWTHYEGDPSHALVVNVETLECWCYGCDDYVVSGEKRNQVIAEAQAAVQKAKPLVKPIDKTDSRRSGKPKPFGAAGLVNLGNTCFFNSVMQCMAYTNVMHPIALAAAAKGAAPEKMKHVPLFAAANDRVLTKAFLNFIRVMREQLALQKSATVNPSILFGHLSNKYKMYKSFRQQDSHELLRCLLDAVKEEQLQRDERDRVFGGKLVSAIVCDTCKNVSYRFEEFLDLSVPIYVGEERGTKGFSIFSAMKKRLSRSPSPATSNGERSREPSNTPKFSDDLITSAASSKSPTPQGPQPTSLSFEQARFLETLLRPIETTPIPGTSSTDQKPTVQKCIQAFTAVDVLEGSNGFACEFCNGTIDPSVNPNFRMFNIPPALQNAPWVHGETNPHASPNLQPRLQARSSFMSLPALSNAYTKNGRPISMVSVSSTGSWNDKTSFETSSVATDLGTGNASSSGISTLMETVSDGEEAEVDGEGEVLGNGLLKPPGARPGKRETVSLENLGTAEENGESKYTRRRSVSGISADSAVETYRDRIRQQPRCQSLLQRLCKPNDRKFYPVGTSGRTRKVEDGVTFRDVIDLAGFVAPQEVVEVVRRGEMSEDLMRAAGVVGGDGEEQGVGQAGSGSVVPPPPPRTVSASHWKLKENGVMAKEEKSSSTSVEGLKDATPAVDDPPLPPRTSSVTKFTVVNPAQSVPARTLSSSEALTVIPENPIVPVRSIIAPPPMTPQPPPRMDIPPPPVEAPAIVVAPTTPPARIRTGSGHQQHQYQHDVADDDGWVTLPAGDRTRSKFKLYGVVVHIGSIFGGHYVAYVRVPAVSVDTIITNEGGEMVTPSMPVSVADITVPAPAAKMGGEGG
ncbi:hypothetical protein BC829DRAFT_415243 [Chytridium lagenaria]|nr:hypothetical protein BC829DRAFT_415243 [Chytridium lagenaria]